MNNEFIIKINSDSQGNELSLSSITIEVADALKIFIESLTDFAKLEGGNQDIRIALKEGCIESCLIYPPTRSEIQDDIYGVIEGNSKDNEKIKLLKDIQDKIKQNGLDYSVYLKMGGETIDLTQSFKAKKFPLRREKRIVATEKIEFITGNLFESGGKVNTNIHLTSTTEDYTIECTKDQAIDLNRRLYNDIYLVVVKKMKIGQKPKFILLDSYLTEMQFFSYRSFYETVRQNKTLEKYDIVYDRIVQIIDNDTIDNGEILKIMRLYNHTESDRGVIRTILMTLKPVLKKNEKLTEMYKSLANVLRAGSSNNSI